MPTKNLVRTPLGEFPTVAQAAAAHKCDRHTIMARAKSRPTEYQVTKIQVPAKPKVTYERAVKGVRWPISWSQYRIQELDVKEEIYSIWCVERRLDPDTESTAEQFFDEMELYVGDSETEDTQNELED